ncbi:MAG: nucleotidyl transferase AbiEii/AbiGii toxin family protein [Acidimicrobiales bacterium]
MLAAIADWPDSNRVTFFGGTACRTWLPDLRLSEDIDLLIDSPTDGDGLRTHHQTAPSRVPEPHLDPPRLPAPGRNVESHRRRPRGQGAVRPAARMAGDSFTIEPVQLRYWTSALGRSQSPDAYGFAAMKLMAWFDRHTRDLYDSQRSPTPPHRRGRRGARAFDRRVSP